MWTRPYAGACCLVDARRCFTSTSTGIGPGSMASCEATCSETKSPIMIRSKSWSSPDPSARTSITEATASPTNSRTRPKRRAHLGVLEIAAQGHDRHHLAGDVAVLPETADLVVAPLGLGGEERPGFSRSRSAASSSGGRRRRRSRSRPARERPCGRAVARSRPAVPPPSTRLSRRLFSCVTAALMAGAIPAKRPRRSRATSKGAAIVATPARG